MMAMAMQPVAAGAHHLLQHQASSSRRFPHRKILLRVVTNVSETRTFVGDCSSHTTARNRRREASKSRTRRRWWELRAGGEEILEGDVVEYPLPEAVLRGGLYGDSVSLGVGAVAELLDAADPASSSSSSSSNRLRMCHIQPLVMNEPPNATWVVDEHQDTVVVPLTEVRRLEAWLSMRMVDDRISNPHGEHAEHLWLVEEPLSESSGSPIYRSSERPR